MFQKQEQARIARTQTARVLLPTAAPKLKSPASPTGASAPSSPTAAQSLTNEPSPTNSDIPKGIPFSQQSPGSTGTDGKPAALLDDRYTSDEDEAQPVAAPPEAEVRQPQSPQSPSGAKPVTLVPLKPAPPMTAPTATPQPAIPRPPAAVVPVSPSNVPAAPAVVPLSPQKPEPLDPPPSAMVPNRRDVDTGASEQAPVQADFSSVQWPAVKSDTAEVGQGATVAVTEPSVSTSEQPTPEPSPVPATPPCAYPGCTKPGILPCPACKKAALPNPITVQRSSSEIVS